MKLSTFLLQEHARAVQTDARGVSLDLGDFLRMIRAVEKLEARGIVLTYIALREGKNAKRNGKNSR